jgi:hypothetical protein
MNKWNHGFLQHSGPFAISRIGSMLFYYPWVPTWTLPFDPVFWNTDGDGHCQENKNVVPAQSHQP